MRRRDRIVDTLLILTALLGVALIFASVMGAGLSTSIAGVRLSSRTAFRPALITAAAMLLALRLFRHRREQFFRIGPLARRHSPAIAAALAILTFLGGLRYGTFEAAAADQYGYISQAHLWARGDLHVAQPLAATAPWPHAAWTLAPLGYRPGQLTGTIVPSYSPGLPLAMAALTKLFGADGVYLAVPLFGAMAVALTFVLGRRMAGDWCGFTSVALLLTSATFLFHLREPLSDVPVTAWWLLAFVLAFRGSGASALGAGVAASAAVLTRPNILPLAIPLAIAAAAAHADIAGRMRGAALVALGLIPGCAAVATINARLYGSPLESGYGSLDTIFHAKYLVANLTRYPAWLVQTETPLVGLAVLAPLLLASGRRMAMILLAAAVVLFACYAFYLPFESWTYLRFLLPAFPWLLVLTSAVVVIFTRRQSEAARLWCIAAVCLLLAWRWDTAVSHGFQPMPTEHRRFQTVGLFVRDHLPGNAVFVSVLHSGSIRYYSGKMTVRWDWLGAEWLDRSLEFLRAEGYHPYIVIDEVEREEFQSRFDRHSPLAALDWDPVATLAGATQTRIYDPGDKKVLPLSEGARSRASETGK